jgi:hypothetical protein
MAQFCVKPLDSIWLRNTRLIQVLIASPNAARDEKQPDYSSYESLAKIP